MFWNRSRRQIGGADPGLAQRAIALFRSAEKDDYYTFAFLVEKLRPTSPEKLAIVLAELVARNSIDRIVRVFSRRSGGGIGDFDSVTSVPLEIFDRRVDETFEVAPGDIQILFAPHVEGRTLERASGKR